MGKLIAIIGAGGKTSTMLALAERRRDSRVLITTTTHIYPVLPPVSREFLDHPQEQQLLEALEKPGVVCAGILAGEKKLAGLPEPLFRKAADKAELTICEADGARMHPMKLHRPGEPVIPSDADLCILVAGLSALGKPVSQVIHRWQRRWADQPEQIAGISEMEACILEAVSLVPEGNCRIRIFLNQLDAMEHPEEGRSLEKILQEKGFDCRAGSLRQNQSQLTDWMLR